MSFCGACKDLLKVLQANESYFAQEEEYKHKCNQIEAGKKPSVPLAVNARSSLGKVSERTAAQKLFV